VLENGVRVNEVERGSDMISRQVQGRHIFNPKPRQDVEIKPFQILQPVQTAPNRVAVFEWGKYINHDTSDGLPNRSGERGGMRNSLDIYGYDPAGPKQMHYHGMTQHIACSNLGTNQIMEGLSS